MLLVSKTQMNFNLVQSLVKLFELYRIVLALVKKHKSVLYFCEALIDLVHDEVELLF